VKTRGATHVAVRQAQAGDLDAVVAMRSALLESSRGNPINRHLRRDFSEKARPFFASQLDDARCLTLLALDGERPIGMLRCMLSAANPLHDPPRHGYVLSVYVEPAHRRSGVLSALMRQADAWCAHQGAAEMRLHCGIKNRVGNAAWKALGFEAAEVLRVRRIPQRTKKTAKTSTTKHGEHRG
jgi:GNAT superfamily N-acetyltransferase